MKYVLMALLTILTVVGLVTIATINIPTTTQILVKIESPEQLNLIAAGHPKEIIFVSLKESIYGDNIKVLTVKSHPILKEPFNDSTGPWLDSLSVAHSPYPR